MDVDYIRDNASLRANHWTVCQGSRNNHLFSQRPSAGYISQEKRTKGNFKKTLVDEKLKVDKLMDYIFVEGNAE